MVCKGLTGRGCTDVSEAGMKEEPRIQVNLQKCRFCARLEIA